MPVAFEGYTGDGLVRGRLDTDGPLEGLLETCPELQLHSAELVLIDGNELATARIDVVVDDLVAVAASPSVAGPVHAVWHDITLAAGPYRIDGLLPTVPGFDPARALARPGGTFVLIVSASIRLDADPAAGDLEYARLLVNRYTVDRVASDIELSLFFPGAVSEVSSRAGRPDDAPRRDDGSPPGDGSSPDDASRRDDAPRPEAVGVNRG
jgi:hypothetical protein